MGSMASTTPMLRVTGGLGRWHRQVLRKWSGVGALQVPHWHEGVVRVRGERPGHSRVKAAPRGGKGTGGRRGQGAREGCRLSWPTCSTPKWPTKLAQRRRLQLHLRAKDAGGPGAPPGSGICGDYISSHLVIRADPNVEPPQDEGRRERGEREDGGKQERVRLKGTETKMKLRIERRTDGQG